MKTIEVNPKEDKTPRWAEMANLTSNLRGEAFIVQCACSGKWLRRIGSKWSCQDLRGPVSFDNLILAPAEQDTSTELVIHHGRISS